MTAPEPDTRSEARKALDEQIASEPHPQTAPLTPGIVLRPVEELMRERR